MGNEIKNSGFMGRIKEGLGHAAQRILATLYPPITEGVEKAIQNLEDRTIRIEKRAIRAIFSSAAIGFGAIFLAFALFSFLREYLGWSNSAAYFLMGLLMLAIGLLVKAGEAEQPKRNGN